MSNIKVVERKYLIPFIVITSLFALWGFANDITNPMVAAFKSIMEISNFKAALVQAAFYGGYGTMAIPAALFIKKFTYKRGIIVGLGLYATGALLFFPAAQYEIFAFFLLSLYILTFGLAFLETTANPYILMMGDEETATRRLNLAQSFNPLGSILGMTVASKLILSKLGSEEINEATGKLIWDTATAAEKAVIRTNDLSIIRNPYVLLGCVVILMLVLISVTKMPRRTKIGGPLEFRSTVKRLLAKRKYREGVLAQAFYVGAQIMCWTFIIQYAENLGIPKATAQNYNIIAMATFIVARFISTGLMKYINATKLMIVFAFGGMVSMIGTITIVGMPGLYCLIATSFFMSLMFPTIYGIALRGLGDDATIGSAGLVMAIVGGALMPPIQGLIIDQEFIFNHPAVNVSFVLPLICFAVVALYGKRALQKT